MGDNPEEVTMSGPAPKHPSTRARRNKANAGFRTLAAVPSAGVPAWPLSADVTQAATIEQLRDRVATLQQDHAETEDRRKRYRLDKQIAETQIALGVLELQVQQAADLEAGLWADMWRAPQAAIWAENSATVRELALYCRWMIRAEQGDTKAAAEARQLSDRLGINPAALLKLRAEIENVDAAEDRGRRRRERASSVPEGDQAGASGAEGDGPAEDPRRGLFAV